jgi:hypothetical protein
LDKWVKLFFTGDYYLRKIGGFLFASYKSRLTAGATAATTGAMQLAEPACGDLVTTLRTHGGR